MIPNITCEECGGGQEKKFCLNWKYWYVPHAKRVVHLCHECSRFVRDYNYPILKHMIKETVVENDNLSIIDVLILTGACKSRSVARRLIAQGVVEVDGERAEAIWEKLSGDGPWKIKVGEKTYSIKEQSPSDYNPSVEKDKVSEK